MKPSLQSVGLIGRPLLRFGGIHQKADALTACSWSVLMKPSLQPVERSVGPIRQPQFYVCATAIATAVKKKRSSRIHAANRNADAATAVRFRRSTSVQTTKFRLRFRQPNSVQKIDFDSNEQIRLRLSNSAQKPELGSDNQIPVGRQNLV